MFAPRFFAPRFFAPRYFPPGAEVVEDVVVKTGGRLQPVRDSTVQLEPIATNTKVSQVFVETEGELYDKAVSVSIRALAPSVYTKGVVSRPTARVDVHVDISSIQCASVVDAVHVALHSEVVIKAVHSGMKVRRVKASVSTTAQLDSMASISKSNWPDVDVE